MTVCLFGGSYRRRAEALDMEAERERRKENEKAGRRNLKKERMGNEACRGKKRRKKKVTSTEDEAERQKDREGRDEQRKGHKD